MSEIESALRSFITETYLYDGDAADLPRDRSLIEEGLIDSTGVLELVTFLEERFGIEINDSEIVPDNLDSIAAIEAFIAKKQPAMAVA